MYKIKFSQYNPGLNSNVWPFLQRYSLTGANLLSPSQWENAESNVISGFQRLEIIISSKVYEREFRMKTTQEIPRQNEFYADEQKHL